MLSDAFPDLDTEGQMAKAKAVQSWRAQSVLGRMKLVPCASLVASTAAVRDIDAMFAAVCCAKMKQLELMDVGPELLVPPLVSGTTSEVTAAWADVGDCVVFVGADDGTTPPFGTLGVAIAVHDRFMDVLCAEKLPAGTDLEGRVRKGYGARLSFDVLLNLSDMSGAEMHAPTAKPVASAGTPRQQAVAAPVPAAPMIPDGTRGFHQQNGFGRGRPAGTITPQALMQAASAASTAGQSNGVATVSVQPATAVPDFMLNLLRTAQPAGQPAADALTPAPALPTVTPSTPPCHAIHTPGISASKNTVAGGKGAADDMVMRLLQGATRSQATAPAAPAAAPSAPSAAASGEVAAAAATRSVAPAPGSSAGAVHEPELSPVHFFQIPSTGSLAEMPLENRRAAIKANVVQVLQVAQSVFQKAGNRAMHSSAASLAKV